jgi:phosphate/sulfate permease
MNAIAVVISSHNQTPRHAMHLYSGLEIIHLLGVAIQGSQMVVTEEIDKD